MKIALLGALFLFTAACGAYQFPSSPTPHTGTVSGRVLMAPCGPVQQAGDSCVGRPPVGFEIDFVDGKTIQSTVIDPKGDYSIQLSPATYQVQFKTSVRIVSGPKSVTVTANSNLVANYVLDSGIRLSVPQQQ